MKKIVLLTLLLPLHSNAMRAAPAHNTTLYEKYIYKIANITCTQALGCIYSVILFDEISEQELIALSKEIGIKDTHAFKYYFMCTDTNGNPWATLNFNMQGKPNIAYTNLKPGCLA